MVKKNLFFFPLFLLPIVAIAANDVSITAPVNFTIARADDAASSTVQTGSSGQVTNFDVQSNYIDITLDNLSAVTLDSITASTYLTITKESGSNSYSVNPSCPTSSATLSGSGATVVLRLETFSTTTCAATSTPTSTPPTPSGGGGAGGPPLPPTPTPTPPAGIISAITGFYALQSGANVILSWNNPTDSNFAGVRILRSTSFFPTSPTDGTLVYQGPGAGDLDPSLLYNTTYYYAAFAYDTAGDYSGGALAEVFMAPPQKPQPIPSGGTTTQPTITIPEVFPTTTAPAIQNFNTNYVFSQKNTDLAISASGTISASINNNLTISVDTSQVITKAKTFIVKITDPKNQNAVSAYSFNANQAGNQFTVTLSNFSNPGLYPFSITAYDANNKPIATRRGYINVTRNIIPYIVGASLLPIPIIWWIIWKREEEEAEEEIVEEIVDGNKNA